MAVPAAVYRPRYPQATDYYHCVEDYFETFVTIYDEHFSRQYGFWRPYVEKVIYRYLDCGDPHNELTPGKCRLQREFIDPLDLDFKRFVGVVRLIIYFY